MTLWFRTRYNVFSLIVFNSVERFGEIVNINTGYCLFLFKMATFAAVGKFSDTYELKEEIGK